jgi:DNA-binding response OmpR family regulator
VLKRSSNGSGNIYDDGYLFVDFDKLTASVDGKAVTLTPTEYKLLRLFTTNRKAVLTRQIALEKVWDNDGNFVDEHALTVNINRLRGKIEDDAHKYIKTVYAMGYQWAGDAL